MNRTLQTYLRYVVLVGIFIIPFLPLIVSNSLFFPFITGKNFTFRIVVEIIFAAWVILAATDVSYRPRRSWVLYTFGAFVGIMALADAFSINPFKSFWSNYERMEGWVTLAHLLAYFVVASTVLVKEKLWDALFQTSLGVNLVIVLYSMLQISHLITINQGGVRADATLGNASYLAIYTVFHIFISALFLLRPNRMLATFKNGFIALGFNAGFFFFMLPLLKSTTIVSNSTAVFVWAFVVWIIVNLALYLTVYSRQERIVYGLILAFNIVVLYHTATRGAILGLIGGALITGILIALFERERPVVRKFSVGILVAVLLVIVGFFAMRNTEFVRTSPVLSRFASISATESTTLSRFKLWNMALTGFKQRPILGWGQESFNYVFNKNYNPELYAQEQWFDRTHNVILDWLIAGGIFGLAAYLAFFGSVFFYIWRVRGNGSFTISERGVLTGLLVAYFIHNIFVFDNLISYVMFIMIAAYVHARTTRTLIPASHPVSNRVVAPIVVVALILMIYAVNARPLLANRTLIAALSVPQNATDLTPHVDLLKKALSYNTFGTAEIREQIFSMSNQVLSIGQEVKGGQALLTLAQTEGLKQLEDTPEDTRYYYLYGTFIGRVNPQEALKYLQKAHELSPRKQSIIFPIAGAYMALNDYTQAKEWLKKAYELEPSYMQARMLYASAGIYTNDTKLTQELLAPLSTSTIANSDDIVQAYYSTKQYKNLIALWKQRVEESPTAQNHLSLAASYLYAQDRTNAIAEIQEAIKLEPSFKEQGESYIKDIRAGKDI